MKLFPSKLEEGQKASILSVLQGKVPEKGYPKREELKNNRIGKVCDSLEKYSSLTTVLTCRIPLAFDYIIRSDG